MPFWLGGVLIGGAIGGAILSALFSDDEEDVAPKQLEGFEPISSDRKKQESRKQLSDLIFKEYRTARKEQTKSFLKLQAIENCKFKPANRNRSPDQLIERVRDAVHEKLAMEKLAIEKKRAELDQIEQLCAVLEDLSKPAYGEHG